MFMPSSRVSAGLAPTAKGPPRIDGEVFGQLINLSGRRRFLSQRVVLFVLLAEAGQADALAQSQRHLQLFEQAHQSLVQGGSGLPGLFCAELLQAHDGADGLHARVLRFVQAAKAAQAELTHKRPATPLVPTLVAASSALLEAINDVTALYEDLARRESHRGRTELLHLIDQIDQIARQARIVSFNAMVVAARSQDQGKPFAVIASEITHMTGEIDTLVQKARTGLKTPKPLSKAAPTTTR